MSKKVNTDCIVSYIVLEGTRNTEEGNWIFPMNELLEKFNVTYDWFIEHMDDIFSGLYMHEEVADVAEEIMDDKVQLLDVCFYSDYCPKMLKEDTNDISILKTDELFMADVMHQIADEQNSTDKEVWVKEINNVIHSIRLCALNGGYCIHLKLSVEQARYLRSLGYTVTQYQLIDETVPMRKYECKIRW